MTSWMAFWACWRAATLWPVRSGIATASRTLGTQNSSGCWYWSLGYCGNGEVCSSGTCVCGNVCVEGAKACDATYSDQIDICAVDPNDYYATCPYWQASSYCQSGYICKNKVCSLP